MVVGCARRYRAVGKQAELVGVEILAGRMRPEHDDRIELVTDEDRQREHGLGTARRHVGPAPADVVEAKRLPLALDLEDEVIAFIEALRRALSPSDGRHAIEPLA